MFKWLNHFDWILWVQMNGQALGREVHDTASPVFATNRRRKLRWLAWVVSDFTSDTHSQCKSVHCSQLDQPRWPLVTVTRFRLPSKDPCLMQFSMPPREPFSGHLFKSSPLDNGSTCHAWIIIMEVSLI